MRTFEGSQVLRNRTSGIIGLASIPIIAAIFASALIVQSSALLMVAAYFGWTPLVALAHHLAWLRTTTRPARFDVSNGSVSIDGATKHVTRARIIPEPAGRDTMVEIARRFDPYPARVALPTIDDARNFVRALGLDSREGATRFHGPVTEGAIGSLIVITLICSVAGLVTLGLPGLLLAVIAAVVLGFVVVPTFTIGRDGILIERFFRKRFLPYSQVVAFQREERRNWEGQSMVSRGFSVILASGESVFIDTTRERMRDYMFEGDHLFEEAVKAHESARAEQPRAADMLARGSRPMKEWLRQLDGARDVRYRVAALSDEELALVLANPSADKTARVGAAICLARGGDEARMQVRVAAEDIAEPDVRAAALAATADDEEALAEALEALE